MSAGSPVPYSQPIPEEVFQDAKPNTASPGTGNSRDAVEVMYNRGDTVWYRQRDGSEVPAKVVAVDMAVYPPSYGVMIGDNIRETEASRLQTRGSLKTMAPDLHPAPLQGGSALQPTSSGASFGSFTDGADPSMQPTTSLAPSYSQGPAADHNQASSLQAWLPAQGALSQSWPRSPEWQGSQGSTTQPWLGSPQWQGAAGTSNQSWPPAPQWAQSAPDQPLPSHLHPKNQGNSVSDSPLQNGAWPSSNGIGVPSYVLSQPTPTQNGASHQATSNRQSAYEHPLGISAVQGLSDDDDGFGDFAAANGAASVDDDKQQPAEPALHPADRSAPLSLSLFGEDSATSFPDEASESLQVGPVWSPAWQQPPSPASSLQNSQHVQPAHQQQQQQQQQQQFAASQPTAVPAATQSLPDSEDESAFGSFTGNDTQPAPSWGRTPQVESAQEYISEAEQQAPSHLHSVTGSALSADAEESEATSQAPLRPAAAAATAAVLQSMDRSAPISLGLFGEESYEDPVIQLPAQVAFQGSATDLQQEAVPTSPRQLPSASAAFQPKSPGRLQLQPQPAEPLHDFKAQHALPQHTFQSEHQLEPSWQLPTEATPPTQSSSSFLPDTQWQDTAQDDFSPSWQQADENDFGASWHQPQSDSFLPSASPFPAQDANGFAATWPQSSTSADPHYQLPGRQAVSGPISLELFGLEEQEDDSLKLPAQATDSGIIQSSRSAVTDGLQHSDDTAAFPPADSEQSQQLDLSWQLDVAKSGEQLAPVRQNSPDPISLELFGMEETADAPMDLPVQATLTVLPTADSSDITGSAALQPPACQTSPGPISLELFGVEETEDAALDLPVQAAITVLPTVASSIDRSTTDAQSTLGGALDELQSTSISGWQYGQWEVQTLLMQACALELSKGNQVWAQVTGNDKVQEFLADPAGAAYLAGLQQVWRVALLLQAGADLHGLARTSPTASQAAFQEASRESMTAMSSGAVPGQPLLADAMHAQQIKNEVSRVEARSSEWMSQQASSEPEGLSSATQQLHPHRVCALSLLPIELVDLPAMQLQPELQCLVPVAALWINRVGQPLPGM